MVGTAHPSMTPTTIALLAGLFFVAALLYSMVGHAGASAYLAAMALFSVERAYMNPTALPLNIPVATIGLIKFYRAVSFSWPLFWPFALVSAPVAFLGGKIPLPDQYYKPLLGLVLWFAAFWLWVGKPSPLHE